MQPTTHPPSVTACDRRALLKGAAITLAVNAGIALALWLAQVGPLDEQMVYSQAIGLTIFVLMNAGAAWLARPDDPGGFPRGWRAAVLIPTVIGMGAVVGTTLGNLYAGRNPLTLLMAHPRLAGMMLGITFVAGGAMTLYFYLAGKSSYLLTELERTRRQTTEAQLRLLESQLEPHMLFNTLANLRVLIGLDPHRAQSMLDHLVAYLRSTLAASRSTEPGAHTLALEFERLNDYLSLMAIRMGPRLQMALDLPDALRHHPLPPLLLQPLVENAIQHGLEPHVQGGSLRVTARTTGPWLELAVEDNGCGIGHPQSVQRATPPASKGFGLAQVRERLATAYGPPASVDLSRRPDGWTQALVRIPLAD